MEKKGGGLGKIWNFKGSYEKLEHLRGAAKILEKLKGGGAVKIPR